MKDFEQIVNLEESKSSSKLSEDPSISGLRTQTKQEMDNTHNVYSLMKFAEHDTLIENDPTIGDKNYSLTYEAQRKSKETVQDS